MLEIFALFFLCSRMGKILRAKGWRKPIWMQIGVVFAWFGGMFFGNVSYSLYLLVTKGEAAAAEPGFAVYPIAFLSACVAVAALFLIASFFPNKRSPLPVVAGEHV